MATGERSMRVARLLAITFGVVPACARLASAHDAGGPVGPGDATAIAAALLPRDLSPWGMFIAADPVVKGIMIGLLLGSVITWTVCLAKAIEIAAAKRRERAGLTCLVDARSMADGLREIGGKTGPAFEFLEAAAAELALSAEEAPAIGIQDRVASRFERIEAAARRGIARGTGILATIGATSPFIGLFGTVWGIMNSFIGISKANTTNLAVVAPGIAEALLATACGLAAAIPAVFIYNAFSRSIADYRDLLGDVSAAALRLLSRDLEHRRVSTGCDPVAFPERRRARP